MADVAEQVAAWRQTVAAVLELAEGFGAADWAAPTECPEWTVKDVYAHLAGGELWMAAGHFAPADGLDAIAGQPVAARQRLSGAQVVAELRQVIALRDRQLATNPPDPDVPTRTAFGLPVTVGVLLGHRAFDFWTHEQDIRRATHRPGNLGTPSAHLSARVLSGSLPYVVAKLAAAPPDSTVRITVDGEVPFDHAVAVDGTGRGRLVPWAGGPATTHRADTGRHTGPDSLVPPVGGPVTAHLRMDWETYARLASGRIPPTTAPVHIDGDQELAARILARFAITP